MMRKAFPFIILIVMCLLAGCGDEPEKLCLIVIQSADGTGYATLERQTQEDVARLLDEENWVECAAVAESLSPKYILYLYQEKTHTLLGPENTYEKTMEYTVYEGSDIVKATVCGDIMKGGFIAEEDLTVYYRGTEEFFSSVNSAVEP